MEEMSITRALTTLKTLDKKIKKAKNASFITYKVGNKVAKEINALENLQSVVDLITRRNKIKKAVIASNAVTTVVIGGETYTVAEAVDRKQSIEYDEMLWESLREQYIETLESVELVNNDVERRLDKLIEASLGSDSAGESYDAIAKPFRERNEASIHDVIGIENKISKLENKIDDFRSDVDVVLSESNAKTTIRI